MMAKEMHSLHLVMRETLESHIFEVMWRNKYGKYQEIFPNLFQGLCTIYPLTRPPHYHYEVPFFAQFGFQQEVVEPKDKSIYSEIFNAYFPEEGRSCIIQH